MARGDGGRAVTVNSILTVVASTPHGPRHTNPLTVLDHAMGIHTLHLVFYYRRTASLITGDAFDLGRIRVSLSQAISQYPAVTGRLIRSGDHGTDWAVKWNDAGVRVLRATVAATLDEWLAMASVDGRRERDLTVWEDMGQEPYIWSPFRIQINEFDGGGLAIGLSCTHLVADPTSAIQFLTSWAHMYRRQPIPQPPVFHQAAFSAAADRSIPEAAAKSAIPHAFAAAMASPAVKMKTATFSFPHATIEQRLSEVHSQCPDATPFDLLAAVFWTRLAKNGAPAPGNAHRLCVGMDGRRLEGQRLPRGYFGNALHFSLLTLGTAEMDGVGLGRAADLVHGRVVAAAEEKDAFWSPVGWLESRRGEDGSCAPPVRVYGHELTCIDLESLVPSPPSSMSEAAMFDCGERPVSVGFRVGNLGREGLVVVMPSPGNQKGHTVTATLPEDRMEMLVEDEVFRQLQPAVGGGG